MAAVITRSWHNACAAGRLGKAFEACACAIARQTKGTSKGRLDGLGMPSWLARSITSSEQVHQKQRGSVFGRSSIIDSSQMVILRPKDQFLKGCTPMDFSTSAGSGQDTSKDTGDGKEEFDFEVFDSLSNKRKRHVIKELLVTGASQGGFEDEEEKLPMRVISVNRTCKVTKAGVLPSFVGFVITGNGSGAIGYGKGKGRDVQQAVRKAHASAMKNLQVVELFDNHTINHDIEHTFCKTKVKLMAAPKGSGVRANTIIAEMCRLAGIKDLRAKVIGSRHPQNTVKAVMEAFQLIQSPKIISRIRGVHMELVQ